MKESELFRQAGLPSDWADEFVVESNKIDPQPGPSGPGSELFDAHREAVIYAIRMASEDRYALPKAVHKMLLPSNPFAGNLRTRELKIGINPILNHKLIPSLFWQWNRSVHQIIDDLRTDDDSIDPDMKISSIWNLHCEFEAIHPYESFNGKVGRILMVNHALLADVDPWIIPCDLGREAYFDVLRNHASSSWGVSPPQGPIAIED